MISDLTGLDLANASLLDEATAAAEALGLCRAVAKGEKKNAIFASDDCHPQTLGVLRTRAEGLAMTLYVGDPETADFAALGVGGAPRRRRC